MCMFCAAIPVAAATGVRLNSQQLKTAKKAADTGSALPARKPVMKITAGVMVLLAACSVAYHSLTSLPY